MEVVGGRWSIENSPPTMNQLWGAGDLGFKWGTICHSRNILSGPKKPIKIQNIKELITLESL